MQHVNYFIDESAVLVNSEVSCEVISEVPLLVTPARRQMPWWQHAPRVDPRVRMDQCEGCLRHSIPPAAGGMQRGTEQLHATCPIVASPPQP